MAIGIAVLMVVVAFIAAVVFVAFRVIARARPPAVELGPSRVMVREPAVERKPRRYALPPVTIDVAPIQMVPPPKAPMPAATPAPMVPPIDRSLFAALFAAGSHAATPVRPERLARGSIPPGYDDDLATDDDDDLDDAETLGGSSDLDDAAMTRANMRPVA